MATTSALVVPVFIWHAPPSHNVTASYLSLEHGRFITASDKGHVVLWKFSNQGDEQKLEPQVMCFTQEAAAITALEVGPFNERECLIGVSTSGSIFVWSLTDGQCQFSKSNAFKCTPTTLKMLPDRRHVAAAGYSPHVEILDLVTMRVVRRMGPHQDWLVSLDWCVHARQPMLVSVSQDNMFRLWMLDEALLKPDGMSYSAPKEEHLAVSMIPLTEDKGASLGKPRQALVSPSGSGLLVVHEHQVSVYSLPITNMSPGWSISSKASFISAFWCDDLTVLLFNALGQGFLHRLPRSVLPMHAQSQSTISYSSLLFGSSLNSDKNAPSAGHLPASLANDSTTASLSPSNTSIHSSLLTKRVSIRESGQIHDIFKIASSWKPSLTTENGTLLAELVVPEAIRRTFAITEIHPGCVDQIIYLIHGNGQVIIWDLPTNWDKSTIQSQLAPTLEARLSEGWATKSAGNFPSMGSSSSSSVGPIGGMKNSGQSMPGSSSSMAAIPQLDLSGVTGITSSNGDLFETSSMKAEKSSENPNLGISQQTVNGGAVGYRHNFVTASLVLEKRLQLISGYADGTIAMSKLPLDLNPRSWRAHNSRVNALLLMPFDNKEYLVSGSSDFYIRVWDLEAEPPVLVHTFANHCGPVRALFSPDAQDVRRFGWKNRFFSIGEDRIVGLFGVDRTPHCVRVFPNHPAPIQEVRWRPDEDYLLVQCNDGTVAVWEMESGTLESTVRGPDADTILSFAKNLSRQEPGQALRPVSRQSITGACIPIEGESPVQAVLLNIKYISQELAEHLQQFDQQRQALQSRMRRDSIDRSSEPPQPSSTTTKFLKRKVSFYHLQHIFNIIFNPDPKMSKNSSSRLLIGSSKIVQDTSKAETTSPRMASSDSHVLASPTASSTGTSSTMNKEQSKLSLFLSAAQLGTYRSCAYLLPWGLDQDNDQLVIAQLYLKPPKPPVSYGMLGVDGNMSVLVPRASELAGRWQCSDSLTALHTLASVAIAKCLLAYDVNESLQTHEQRTASSHLMSYFCVLLPDKVPHFVYPSLTVLAAFWQDPLEDILQSARVILSSVLNRLSHEQRRMLAIAWGNLLMKNTNIASVTNTPTKLKSSSNLSASSTPGNASSGFPGNSDSSSSSSGAYHGASSAGRASPSPAPQLTSSFLRNQSVLVLAILGCEFPESLPTELAANVALELLEIIFEASNSRMRVAAAELFGKGFQLWSKHLHEEASTLIHRLFKLAMVSEPKNLSKTAARALLLIGEKIPARFTQAISQRFTDLIKSGGALPSSITSPSSSSASASTSSSHASSGSSSHHHHHGSNVNGGALHGMLAASSDSIQAHNLHNPSASAFGSMGSTSGSSGASGGAHGANSAGNSGSSSSSSYSSVLGFGTSSNASGNTSSSSSNSPSAPSAYVQSLREHSKVLVIVGRLVKQIRADFYPELPTLVDAIVKALNPHIPGLRDATLTNGTGLLNLMVSLYPMIAIELNEQRLAVGTRDGLVHVYDLSSATRVHTLTCHAPHAVSAVAFAGQNKVLATYSMETGQVKVWKTTQSLFGILSGDPQTIKSFDVPCSVRLPVLSLSGAEPTIAVVNLKNLSDAAPPSSKTMARLRQEKVAKIDKEKSSSSSSSSSSSRPKPGGFSSAHSSSPSFSGNQGVTNHNNSEISVMGLLEGLSFSWPNPKSIKIERKWEDPALSSLTFPV